MAHTLQFQGHARISRANFPMTNQTQSFRPISSREKKILNHLLAPVTSGREQLEQQLDDCLVRPIDEDGGLEFHVKSLVGANDVKYRVPTEGEAKDVDGVTIHFLLHVVAYQLSELELYKEDGSRVIAVPPAEDIKVFAPE